MVNLCFLKVKLIVGKTKGSHLFHLHVQICSKPQWRSRYKPPSNQTINTKTVLCPLCTFVYVINSLVPARYGPTSLWSSPIGVAVGTLGCPDSSSHSLTNDPGAFRHRCHIDTLSCRVSSTPEHLPVSVPVTYLVVSPSTLLFISLKWDRQVGI